MGLGHIAGHASGASLDACHFLLLRFDEDRGFKPDAGESWIFQQEGKTTHALRGQPGWYTGLWRSPAGHVYVCASTGEIHVNTDPAPRAAPWRVDRVPGTLAGIWGLDDRCVFTWGLRGSGTVVHRFDGERWNEMPSPGQIVGMHGISRDLVYAVGRDGLVARWDGTLWSAITSPARGVLSDVFVVSDDEIYAVGPNKQLLEGRARGWTEVLEGPGPMFGVTRWQGQIWVGAAEHGLMRLDAGQLVAAKPNIKAEKLDARTSLLVSAPQMIAGTSDGAKYTAVQLPFLSTLIARHPPEW